MEIVYTPKTNIKQNQKENGRGFQNWTPNSNGFQFIQSEQKISATSVLTYQEIPKNNEVILSHYVNLQEDGYVSIQQRMKQIKVAVLVRYILKIPKK